LQKAQSIFATASGCKVRVPIFGNRASFMRLSV